MANYLANNSTLLQAPDRSFGGCPALGKSRHWKEVSKDLDSIKPFVIYVATGKLPHISECWFPHFLLQTPTIYPSAWSSVDTLSIMLGMLLWGRAHINLAFVQEVEGGQFQVTSAYIIALAFLQPFVDYLATVVTFALYI